MVQKVDYKIPEKEKSKIWGGFSLALGIISIFPLFIMPYFGLPTAIFAIICNHMQKKVISTGPGTAGFILGIFGIIINIMVLFCMFLYFTMVGF